MFETSHYHTGRHKALAVIVATRRRTFCHHYESINAKEGKAKGILLTEYRPADVQTSEIFLTVFDSDI